MKPGTYGEIMERICESKSAELKKSAGFSFSEKLAAVNRSCQTLSRMLSDSLPEAVFKLLTLFNEGVARGVFAKYAIAGGCAVEFYGAPINTVSRLHINHLIDCGLNPDQARLSAILERQGLRNRWSELLTERARSWHKGNL